MKNHSGQPVHVPGTLKIWFIIHFILDILFAVPLFIAPDFFLKIAGWQIIDPAAVRLVAAALFAIGIESYLGRNAQRDAYIGMLNLKIIWSLAAVTGMLLTFIQHPDSTPIALWLIILIFFLFNLNWIYWRLKLSADKKKEQAN